MVRLKPHRAVRGRDRRPGCPGLSRARARRGGGGDEPLTPGRAPRTGVDPRVATGPVPDRHL